MRALKIAKATGASKEEKKALRKKIRKELKAQGFEKEEIKAIIKENIKIDKEKRIVLLQERGEDVSELIGSQDIVEEIDTPNNIADEDNPDFDPVLENKENKEEKVNKKKDKKNKKKAIKNKKGKKKKAKKNKKGKKKKAAKNKKGKKKKL